MADETAPPEVVVPTRKKASARVSRQWLDDPRPGIERLRGWFDSRGWKPWPFQEHAWAASIAGKSGLIQVATGAGKTFAADFGPLACVIDECRANDGGVDGLRILYITPLRAVSRDVELALKSPVDDLGLPITVETRTGDTKASVRAKQRELDTGDA